MGVNSSPKTVTRQRRDCDLNLGPSAPESSTLTTRLPSHLGPRTPCRFLVHPVYTDAHSFSFDAVRRRSVLCSCASSSCERQLRRTHIIIIIIMRVRRVHAAGGDDHARYGNSSTPCSKTARQELSMGWVGSRFFSFCWVLFPL